MTLTYKVSKGNLHIENSYTIRKVSVMKQIIGHIMESVPSDYPVRQRTMTGMILEWSSHNLLYRLHYRPEQTKSVDLNVDESFLRRLGYCILGSIEILIPKRRVQ